MCASICPPGVDAKPARSSKEVRIERVTVKDGAKGPLEVTCVVASEIEAPAGVKPVVWRLLTNRVATTLAQACVLIDWYRARWEIELFFLVL